MEMSPIVLAHEEPFSIGAAEVRPATRELLFNGQTAILEPRVMQLLVVLHRAKGGVVSKDDLMMLCWEGRIVGEDAINRVVSRLRHDAEEKAGGSFKVETITKVGYRLVTGNGPASDAAPVMRRLSRRQAVAATAGAALAASGAGWWALSRNPLPPRAAELLESGREAMRKGTVDEFANAAASFRAASQIAPDSGEIWGALALAYARQAGLASSARQSDLRARSLAAADRALSLDRTNGDALAAKVAAVRVFGNWLRFEQEIRKALEVQPNHVDLNAGYNIFLTQVGRQREALPFIERAVKIDPNRLRVQVLRASTLWDIGRLDDADAVFEQAFRQWPRNYIVWFGRFHFLAFNGRAAEALAMIHDEANRPLAIPDWNFRLTALQAEAALRRDKATMDNAIGEWMKIAPHGTGFTESAVMFAGAMGRPDAVFALLDAYYFDRGFTIGEQRFTKEQGTYTARSARHTYILFRGYMDPVQRDPRFAPLVESLGLRNYWRKSGTRPDYLS